MSFHKQGDGTNKVYYKECMLNSCHCRKYQSLEVKMRKTIIVFLFLAMLLIYGCSSKLSIAEKSCLELIAIDFCNQHNEEFMGFTQIYKTEISGRFVPSSFFCVGTADRVLREYKFISKDVESCKTNGG